MGVSIKFGLSITALGALAFSALVTPACSSTPSNSGSSSGGGSGSGSGGSGSGSSSGASSGGGTYCGTPGAACCAAPGQVPNPECDDGDETQCAKSSSCAIASTCGSTSTCEPLANNTTATKNFRMRRLILVAPPKLANQTAQNTVVTSGVDLKEPQCGEEGTGLFNWLISLDTAGNTIKTGGAPQCDKTGSPACDPFTTGYCFVNKNVNGIQVGPVTAAVTKGTDGTYGTTAGALPILNIPIYFASSAGAAPTIILLPISNGAISGMKISTDGNCIGSVNPNALAADCSDNYQACSKWKTDGSLSGYITLKTADTVNVALLNESLCALLTGQKGSDGTTCPKDASGNITAQGDYCSTSNKAGDCKDSFWLAATFAASAVTINDGTGVPDCTGGGGTTDAGGGGSKDAASE